MLFQKSAPHMGRSALAAKAKSKKFWSSSSSQTQQAHPSFFVSTPQFNRRQQTQVAPSFDDTHRGSDSYVENPYLPLTAGASTGTGMTHNLSVDEDARDDIVVVSMPGTQTKPIRHQQIQLKYRSTPSISTQRAHTQSAHAQHRQAQPQAQQKDHKRVSRKESPEIVNQVIETIDQSGSSIIDGVISKMRRLNAAGAHLAVLSAFESVDNAQHSLPVEAYNLVLQSLVETSDATTLLQAYEGMLTRGAVPNATTYVTVLNALADTAETLFAKRQSLRPLLGSNGSQELESVCEVYEGLGAEEHLLLAQQIISAVLASRSVVATDSNFLESVNKVVKACWSCNVDVDEIIASTATTSRSPELLIGSQPSIHLAASQFSALTPEDQQSERAQSAMLASYFRFKEPQGAIAFYSGCGAPSYLLKELLVGFASNGYIATARRWSEKNEAPNDIISATLSAIPLDNAETTLPSATRLFYQLVGRGGNGNDSNSDPSANDGRCSFIRLCVAAKHKQALLMAIRESKYADSSWDATTVSDVTAYLCESEPLLASDICSWQVSKIQLSLEEQKLKSFVTQEIVSSTVHALKRHNNFSTDSALRLLDVVSTCVSSRHEALKLICTTRLGKPEEVSRLMNSARALKATTSIATLMLNKTNRLSEEEFALAKQMLPAFVRDCISHRATLSGEELIIRESLRECFPDSPVYNEFNSYCAEQEQQRDFDKTLPLNAKTSDLIQRYALAPHGLDIAFSMLKDEMRLNHNISPSAIESVLHACIANKASDIVSEMFNSLPRTVENLNLLIRYTSIMQETEMCSKCYNELKSRHNVYPTQATYIELFKAHINRPQTLMRFFKEAKSAPNVELDAESYNYVLQSLARARENVELQEVLSDMNSKAFSATPQTYGYLLNMYVRLDEGTTALELLKNQIPLVTKSLLEVRTFNQLMDYFVHKRPDRTSALEVFVELRNTGTLATPHTYRLLMEAYLLRNNGELPSMQHADKVLSMMKRDGAPITNQCFATLLRARGVIFKDFDGARDFYRGLVKTSRILPDKGIFKALLESYVINGRQDESGHVIEEMKRYHVPVDDDIRKMVTMK